MSRLIIFLSLYFCIYGSAHLYLLVKARRAFYLQGVQYVLLFTIFTFLLLAPINSRLLESQGQWLPAVVLAWVGFVWMAFVFIFVCLALPVDGYHLLVSTGQQMLSADWTAIMLSKRQSIGLVSLLTCALMVYGAYEALQIKTEKVALRSDKIPAATGRVRLVLISDLHIGPMFYPGRITPVIAAVKQARPDLLISTGDLVDGHILNGEAIASALQSIPAPLGKFAITGNHEFYAGLKASADFTRKAGFSLLRNQSVSVNHTLIITGVDDPAGDGPESGSEETDLLRRVPKGKFSLLLKHRPQVHPENRQQFDLQLSGHTHRGQIYPFGWLVGLTYPWGHGLRQVAPGCHIYTSRGTGTWGPPIRLLAPPEITIIDLLPAQTQGEIRMRKPDKK